MVPAAATDICPVEIFVNAGFQVVRASWRAGARQRVNSERCSIRPSGLGSSLKERCGGVYASEQERIRATGIGAQPNKRLKLAAPAPDSCGLMLKYGVIEFCYEIF